MPELANESIAVWHTLRDNAGQLSRLVFLTELDIISLGPYLLLLLVSYIPPLVIFLILFFVL